MVAARKNPGREDPWRTRRVLGLYASGDPVSRISLLVGWSEGRVRKVLREAGLVVPEGDGAGDFLLLARGGREEEGRGYEEDRRRLLEAGWETKLRGGLIVWHRPDGRGSWYTQEAALEILEAMEGEGEEA